MKKYIITAIILVLAFTVAACGKSSDETVAPPAPQPAAPVETTPEAPVDDMMDDKPNTAAPVEGNANVLEDTSGALGTGEMQDLGSKVDEVACDADARKITFTVSNVGVKDWNLDQKTTFGDTKTASVKIFVNGYEANRRTPQYHPDTGARMFGPNELFSDNCGGTEVISPGESVQCTLDNVKLNRGTGSNDLRAVNEIFIDSPSVDDYIEFTC